MFQMCSSEWIIYGMLFNTIKSYKSGYCSDIFSLTFQDIVHSLGSHSWGWNLFQLAGGVLPGQVASLSLKGLFNFFARLVTSFHIFSITACSVRVLELTHVSGS